MAELRTLSQSEIDALLNEASDDTPADDDREPVTTRRTERSTADIKPYDFRRPDKFSREQWATLQSMHEHFARILSASLSSRLRTLAQVRLSALEQGLYEEWQAQVGNPTICYVMTLPPLPGNMTVEFNVDVAADVVDRLLGGTGRQYGRSGSLVDNSRELGGVEMALLRSFGRTFTHSLREMWSTVRPVEPTLQDLGLDASLVQVAAASDAVLIAFFEISVGASSGSMTICVPYTTIEPVARGLSGFSWVTNNQRPVDSLEDRETKERLLAHTKIDLAVHLGSAEVTAGTIADLSEGDTLILDARLGKPLDIIIGAHPRFRGLPGVVDGHMGIQITAVLDPPEIPAAASAKATQPPSDNSDARTPDQSPATFAPSARP